MFTIADRQIDPSQWTLREKIGQLIVVRTSGYLLDHQIRYPHWEAKRDTLKQWLTELNLGGIIFLGGSAAELTNRIVQVQSWASTPLLIAADIEEGVGQRFPGAIWFPPPMALGEIAKQNLPLAQKLAEHMGAAVAQEALAVGLNWVLAPIADVNNNPNNPVINVRAFGDTPEIVSALVQSFIQGAQTHPVLTTAKHFPGHGDTSTDSHLQLPVITHDVDRLEAIELEPFRAAIAQGVDSVMTAHLQIPAWDSTEPATLSPAILTHQLRRKLGFEGIIVTDALIMGGITQYGSGGGIAVKAIKAGVDVLLMPVDPLETINAVEAAVQENHLSEARIDESVNRILSAKQRACLPPVLPTHLVNTLIPEGAQAVVADILTAASKSSQPAPLPTLTEPGKNIILVDDLLATEFLHRASPAIAIPQQAGYFPQLLTADLLSQLPIADTPWLLQVFVRGNPFRGTAGLSSQSQQVLKRCLQSPQLQGLIVYGSPYVMEWLEGQIAKFSPQLPWLFTFGQMPQAQELACTQLFQTTSWETSDSEAQAVFTD